MMTASRVSRKMMKKMGTENRLRAMEEEMYEKGGDLGKHLEYNKCLSIKHLILSDIGVLLSSSDI